MSPNPKTSIVRCIAGAILTALFMSTQSWAGPTDPALAVASATVSGGSSRVVVLRGIFPSDDLVQTGYPLQLLVRSLGNGTSYLRFDLGLQVLEGNEASLVDGLDAADVPGLLASGTPNPFARVIGLGPRRLDILLPASFPSGAAEVQLFVLEPGDTVPVLSNPFTIQVPLP